MIDDFLPYGIMIKHGEPSDEFYNIYLYGEKVDEKAYRFLYKFIKNTLINSGVHKDFSFAELKKLKYRNSCYTLYHASEYWQENKYSKKVLSISVNNHVNASFKILMNLENRLLIIYAFLDNQFFPTMDNVLVNHEERLLADLNSYLNENKLSKEKFRLIVNYSFIVFFIRCILSFFEIVYSKQVYIENLQDVIDSFFSPYIRLCKSKYIRINDEFKDIISETICDKLNTESICSFLSRQYSNILYKKNLNCVPYIWNELKKILIHQYNIRKSTPTNYWDIEERWEGNLKDALLTTRCIYLNDYHVCISLLSLLKDDFNNLSKLRYILFCYNICKLYNVQDNIYKFLVKLILDYKLTDIRSYNERLTDDEKKIVKEQFSKLDEIIEDVLERINYDLRNL